MTINHGKLLLQFAFTVRLLYCSYYMLLRTMFHKNLTVGSNVARGTDVHTRSDIVIINSLSFLYNKESWLKVEHCLSYLFPGNRHENLHTETSWHFLA
jgi:hypothetical protein